MKKKKVNKIFSLLAGFALLFNIFYTSLFVLAQEVFAENHGGPPETVTICHSTGAHNNPYITNNPSADGDVSGHHFDDGPIWFPGIEIVWGDIIPPFAYGEGQNYPGLNWDVAGQAIYNNSCEIPVEPELGSITVKKDVVPDDESLWDFDFTYPSNATSEVTLSDGGSETFINLEAGQYTVAEETEPGYITSVSCVDENDVSLSTSNPATFDLVSGDDVTCTFTNSRWPTITVTKYVDPAEDSGNFDLYIDEVKVATDVGDDGSGSKPVGIGEHTVSELAGTETNLSDYDSVIGGDCDVQGNVEITEAGQDAECTITNALKRGSIQGRKYYDVNGNGDFDQSEKDAPGNPNRLDGWTINLYSSLDEDPVMSMVTGDDNTPAGNVGKGQYRFMGVLPGDYYVCEVLQGGWTQTEPGGGCHEVQVGPGQAVTGVQFGNYELGSISGYKYEDIDGNTDTDEYLQNPVQGWEITLWQDLVNLGSTTTASDGSYSFTDLLLGTYEVWEEERGSWTDLTPVTIPLALGVGENLKNNDFVNFRNGFMGGIKWNDINGDGVKEEGEPFIQGWTFELQRWNEDGQNWDVVETDITDANGNWSFTFGPGKFRVYEVPQADWIPTTYVSGYYPSALGLNWTSGARIVGINFGNQGRGTITVYKDVDTNGDGQVDIFGSTDWKWNIDGTGGYPTGSTQGVAADTYIITEDQNDNYHFENLVCEAEEYDIEGDTAYVYVGSGDDVVCTFTNARDTGDIHGYKWNDEDGDGKWGEDEEALGGWTIELYENLGEGGIGDWVASTETMGDDEEESLGAYWFEGVLTGSYYICEVIQDGWEQTYPEGCYQVSLEEHGQVISDRIFGNQLVILDISIDKTNDKTAGASVGDTVNYTLDVSNNGNRTLDDVEVTDVLPGGFTYVAGSTKINGVTSGDPVISGGKLIWSVGSLNVGDTLTIEYQAVIGDDLVEGVYTNLATCSSEYEWQRLLITDEYIEEVGCNVASSDVPIGDVLNLSYGVGGQVLGAATELPASGNDTRVLLALISMGLLGATLKVAGYKLKKEK